MFKNYILVALRNFNRNRFYSFLNIIGLAIGISCAIISFLYVAHELSYDRFHEKSDRIYRIAVDALAGNTIIKQTFTPAAMPAAMYNEFPEIEAITRISSAASGTKVKYENRVFIENSILLVDTTFFDIFSGAFVYGNPDPSILAPNTAILTEQTARKYFGDINPIGKVITVDETRQMTITAVIKEFPKNSHFHFDMLISLLSYDGFYNNPQWFANNFRTYLLLHPNQDYVKLEAKLPAFVDKYLFQGKYQERATKGNKWELYLQPLANIHLHSHLSGEFEPNGNAAYVYIFGVLAVFILVIACINFVNMATAKSATRAREIGIRKVVGSGKQELIRQFLIESFVISLLSMVVALIFVEISLKFMPAIFGIKLNIPFLSRWYTIPALFGLTIFVGFLSGIYPALVLSSMKPVTVFKDQLLKGARTAWLRHSLVVFQFTISIVLIVGTLVISRQLHFLQNERLGFEKDHVIVIKNANLLDTKMQAFKNDLKQIPGVQSVAAAHRLPGIRFNNIGFQAEGFEGGYTLNICMTDPDFQDVLKFKMVQGRYFSEKFGTDTSGVVLNEAAVKLLGWDDAIGKKISNWSEPPLFFNVIGVVADLHYESMHSQIMPMGFFHLDCPFHWTPRYVAARVNSNNMRELINRIGKVWTAFNEDLPFEFSFLEEDYDRLYANEMQTRKIFVTASILAIIIGCLGLLGLVAFMVERRLHEIGIRKVLGASIASIVMLLTGEFTRWVVVANLIAWPVSWLVMDRWLQNFAYRISIGWWMMVVAGITTLIIAFLTVSYQSIKAAVANPVEALRYE